LDKQKWDNVKGIRLISTVSSSVVDLSEFPNTVVDVFIQIPQADAGTRVAGLNAAAMALAHAGIPMKEMISAIGVGKIGGRGGVGPSTRLSSLMRLLELTLASSVVITVAAGIADKRIIWRCRMAYWTSWK